MDTQTALIETGSPRIVSIAQEIASLPEVATWWNDPADELARTTLDLEWWDIMGRVELYARAAERGELSSADQQVVAYMLDALREHAISPPPSICPFLPRSMPS